MNPSFYGIPGHTHTMIHEIGHSLGLYHIFRGISEIQSCSDPCMETEPSFETGDLCSDTNPAPKHKFCGDPGPGNDTCGFHSFFNTPYNNFMSYAGRNPCFAGCTCLGVTHRLQSWFRVAWARPSFSKTSSSQQSHIPDNQDNSPCVRPQGCVEAVISEDSSERHTLGS